MGKKRVFVEHCSKKLKPSDRYFVNDYPNPGDTADVYEAICPVCNKAAFAYDFKNFLGSSSGTYEQADKYRREQFIKLKRIGRFRLVIKNEIFDKPIKIVGAYTKKLQRPAEENITYLKKIESAENQDIVKLEDVLLYG